MVSGGTIGQQSINNEIVFNCYVDSEDLTKLYFYQGEYSHLENNRKWVNLLQNAELSGSQVVLTGNNDKKTSITYETKSEYYYSILYNKYKLDGNNELIVIGSGTKLNSAIYHENNFYSTINYKNDQNQSMGEKLNYKRMIKCYNRIARDNSEEIQKIINLTYDQKVAFVADGEINGVKVRADFVEVLHEDLEYLLACCGFHSLEVNNG